MVRPIIFVFFFDFEMVGFVAVILGYHNLHCTFLSHFMPLVQQQNSVWNLFKVTNKNTRTMSLISFCCCYCQLWVNLTHRSGVPIFDFEQVHTGWVRDMFFISDNYARGSSNQNLCYLKNQVRCKQIWIRD